MNPGDRADGPDEKTTIRDDTNIRVKLLQCLVYLGVPMLAFFGIKDLIIGRYFIGFILLALTFTAFVGFFLVRRSAEDEARYMISTQTMRVFALLFGVYLVYVISIKGEFSRCQWAYIYPLVVLFFFGNKEGLIWTLPVFVGVALPMFFTESSEIAARDLQELKIRFLLSFSMTSIIAFLVQTVMRKQQRNLTLNHAELLDSEKRYRDSYEKLTEEIEERKRIEAKLRESEQNYRIHFENVSDFIYSIDHDFTVLSVSPSVERLLGYRPQDLIGKRFTEFEILASNSIEKAFSDILRVLGGERVDSSIYEFIARDGTVKVGEVSGAPLVKDGRVIAVVAVGRDITARKHAESALREAHNQLEVRVQQRTSELAKANEQLKVEIIERVRAQEALSEAKEAAETANRSKSEFLANMSHELRTPLNHIIGFTELIMDKRLGDLNDVQEEYLNDVLGSSRHLLSLINDILDLSKVEAGRLELELSKCDVQELLERSLAMIKEKALKKGIQLSLGVNGLLHQICADERKLKQIMYNLLSNAVKFTSDGGRIRVTAKSVGAADLDPSRIACGHTNGFVEICVSDSGIGVKPEDQRRIFEPFEQADGSVHRRFQGTGLGLHLTKRLVELHGGEIWVESEGEGRGSVFHFVLPARASTARHERTSI